MKNGHGRPRAQLVTGVMEVIHLRMAGRDPTTLAETVRGTVSDTPGAPEVRVYRHARIEGDLLVHLHHHGAGTQDRPSDIGIRLASLLRAHGLVDHSVWVRQAEPQEKESVDQ